MPVPPRNTADLSEAKRALLARRLKGLAAIEEEPAMICARPEGTQVRLSVDQYRIWVHHSMHPDQPTYNEPVSIFYKGHLDVATLERALVLYAERHEAWRTSFVASGDQVLQRVQPSIALSVAMHDLSGLPTVDRETEELRIATQNALQPFDLTEAPLFRAVVVRVSPNEDHLHMVVHHIAFDGTAIRDSFLPELAAIYTALREGVAVDLAPRALQYPDFSIWREQQANSEAFERSIAFWRGKLAGDLPLLRLPVDRPRPAVISQRGAMRRFDLPPALTTQLRLVGQQHRATLYLVLLASLEALLFRYSGQGDVLIGTGANGRRLPELRGMMGYMLDTFPVRVQAAAAQSFAEFLGTVRDEFLEAVAAAEIPFDQIVKASGARRDSSYHPLFQTFFSFLPPITKSSPGWEIQPKLLDTGTAKFDLYFEAEEFRDGIAACVLYNTDIFDAPTVDRIVGHWTSMLSGIAVDPTVCLGDLPLLTDAERKLMLTDWNRTESVLPASTVHELFSQQALRTPDAVAVQFSKRRLTYAQLNDRAERFAYLLHEAGARTGQLVAICIDRSEDLLAALLGILKTGATYLPLDPGTPLARIALCLEDAAPAVLLTQRSLVEQLPATGARTLLIEELLASAATLADGTRMKSGPVGPDDSAYIIHTSGSTGRPKAVELSHGAVVNLLLSFQREPGFGIDDVLVAVTTVSFDIAVLELFLPIISGGRVVIAPRTTALDPFELSDLLDEVNCTVLQATPATWRSLIAIDWPGREGLRVFCGGEALTRDLADKLLSRELDLWNVYGPTETCIWSTIERVKEGSGPVPVGRPIANTTTFILDAHLQPVPIGVPGELYLGGLGLAKGYRGQPQLTAEKFISLPIASGSRLYRTGDYALYQADGTIVCQGRADNQVKVRGYRIELEEVELHLSAYPELAAAAARVWKDETVGNRLVGYVVMKPGRTLDVREIRRFLQPRLPEYMIPSQFIELDRMPLTPNGKTDRKALPEAVEQAIVAPANDEAMTALEEKLAKIWCAVLDVSKVSRHDNFFDLGGHSLLLVALFARVNREFSSSLPITTIFDAQTLAALAGVLKQQDRISSLVPVQTSGSKAPLFMAHSYLLYRGLSSVLGTEQPFYGLRELESDGELSLENRARHYVEDMRSVQPHGPYHIAGWCAAGPLAVEIARQLIGEGEDVQTLLLFDAWLPEYREEFDRAVGRSIVRSLQGSWNSFRLKTRGESLPQKLRYIERASRRVLKERRDGFYIRHWALMNRLSRRLHLTLPQFMYNTTLQTFAAMREFHADRLPVAITLVRATESSDNPAAIQTFGWERVAGRGVSVLWAPGDHETMFRGANLEQVGGLVRSTLDGAVKPAPTARASTHSLQLASAFHSAK